jgi:two-component system, OmpR family, alkaline phosphatase synthesis response regulator PhoP
MWGAQDKVILRNVELLPARFECWIEGQCVSLSLLEFNLLFFFAKHIEQVLTREQILHGVWDGTSVGERTVDHHVSSVRRKLKTAGAALVIQSCYGEGYGLFSAESSAQPKKETEKESQKETALVLEAA